MHLGPLSQGSATGGGFALVVNGTATPVTNGQADIAVPGGAALVLRYQPASGPAVALDDATAPAACTTVTVAPQRGLTLAKSVSPTGAASVGATLTYTLVVTATGNAEQTGVTVSDYLPGHAPGSASGSTVYVAGSATCSGAGTCNAAYDAATHQVTWGLGTMAAGSSRSVSFQAIIAEPTPEADGGIDAFDIENVGAVRSAQVPAVASNEVVTPVAAVQGTKAGQSGGGSTPGSTAGGMLPRTGSSASLVRTLGIGGLLILLGVGLVSLPVARRRS